VAFINCRKTEVMLANAVEGRWEGRKWRWGEVEQVLVDLYAERLSGLKDKLACHFILATDMIRGGIMEFMGSGVVRYIKINNCTYEPVPTHACQKHLIHFSNVKVQVFFLYYVI
jgi:hypothetical protein